MASQHHHNTIRGLNGSTAVSSSQSVLGKQLIISGYEKLAVMYQNESTAISVGLAIQVAHSASDPLVVSQSDGAPNWVTLPTATLAQPSALGPSATVVTGPIDNCYKYLRVVATSATAILSASNIRVTVMGRK